MERRDTITILEEILSILSKKKNITFRGLQYELKVQWRTLKNCLDFLLKHRLIKEKRGGKEKNSPRYFNLN